jgi:hypothetical protein
MRISQATALELGRQKRRRLLEHVERIIQFDPEDKYPHFYTYSPPGLGKTHTIKDYLERNGIINYTISGNISRFAFGVSLAVIAYNNPIIPIVVLVDDCDEILKDSLSCNMMKNVLEGERKFVYEKSLSGQMGNLSHIQQQAVEYFQDEQRMGFSVDTSNMKFLFTSNIKLPTDDDIQRLRSKKSTVTTSVMVHRNAIRSRCTVADFDLGQYEHWGWIADVVLSTELLLDSSDEDKMEYLNFLWYNWTDMTERSIRTILKMEDIRRKYPDRYEYLWNMDLLKN